MLLQVTNRSSDGVKKTHGSTQFGVQHSTPISVPHRHALTAKLRSRPQLSRANTATLKPTTNSSAYLKHGEPQNEHLAKSQKLSLKNSRNLAHFDSVQLQDFIKLAILGQDQVTQRKSKEIIKSLNGTWFKSTNSQDLSTQKLYNSLGIKKAKVQPQATNNDKLQSHDSRDILRSNYTPPNIFPQRKLSPRRNQLSKYLQGNLNNNLSQIIQRNSPLKDKILRKTAVMKKPQKRSSTSFSSKPMDIKLFDQTEYLLGKKMVLHND